MYGFGGFLNSLFSEPDPGNISAATVVAVFSRDEVLVSPTTSHDRWCERC